MDELAARVERLAREHHPDRYAGLEVAGATVIVYRRPSAGLDAALRALPGGAGVVLRDAPHSARELERLRDEVAADIGYWERRGVVISSLAVKHDGSAVEVGTPDVERAQRELPRRYGPDSPFDVVTAGPIAVVRP